jgi:hypothetical protein
MLWKDCWNDCTPAQAFPELFSFAKNVNISFNMAGSKEESIQNFS